MTIATVTKLKTEPKRKRPTNARRASPKLKVWERKASKHIIISLCAVIITILGVSLEHLAHGIATVTNSATWASWSLAVAIDVGMIASEIALILLSKMPDIGVENYAKRYVLATIVVSMALNTLGFWPANVNVVSVTLAIVLGCGIPAGVYHLTKVAGKLWMAISIK